MAKEHRCESCAWWEKDECIPSNHPIAGWCHRLPPTGMRIEATWWCGEYEPNEDALTSDAGSYYIRYRQIVEEWLNGNIEAGLPCRNLVIMQALVTRLAALDAEYADELPNGEDPGKLNLS